MSRRFGQSGYIEKSGKWWVVRWWMDVDGQYKRKHVRAQICPISGPRSLSKSARVLRACEIALEGGANKRRTGLLFRTRNGKALCSSCVLRRHLHPALKELEYVNPSTGNHKAGSHAFRRIRAEK